MDGPSKIERRISENERRTTFGDPLGMPLERLVDVFLVDRRARHLSAGTLSYYAEKLGHFLRWCEQVGAGSVGALSAHLLRTYLIDLEQAGHNPGGRHGHYRAVKALLLWFENEYEPEDWTNPVRKIHGPKVSVRPLPGVSLSDVRILIDQAGSLRDKALLLCLVDTGARASEFLALNISDVDPDSGRVAIQHGKGDKERVVFLGLWARQTLRKYLRSRTDHLTPNAPLWINREGLRLRREGLRSVVTRVAQAAGMRSSPGLHDFRRCFAITMYRNGVDIMTISKLMGHSSLEVLRRYLDFSSDDLRSAHSRGSPGDNMR